MKLWLFAALLTGGVLISCSPNIRESKVPSVVKNTLSARFSQMGPVEWEREKGNYEAEFRNDTIKALISPAGALVRYKQKIAAGELPAPVQQTLESQYGGHQVEDVEKVIQSEETYYQLELEKGLKEMQVVLTADGAVTNAVPYWD